MLDALRPDALSQNDSGFELRVSLPWIRSMPLAALSDLRVSIDDEVVPHLSLTVGGRRLPVADLSTESGWWFLQDRLVVTGDRVLEAGAHEVRLSFHLTVPYLQIRPDEPLTLPFLFERTLDTDAVAPAHDVARDVVIGALS